MTRRAGGQGSWSLRLSVAFLVLLATSAAGVWLLLRASLPTIDGSVAVSGLRSPVSIERDSIGAVTVTGANRLDVAWGTGYAHAQDRFFQMDLARRRAAGELSELFGEVALGADREARIFRFRAVARDILARSSPADREFLAAYTRGVNAGLAGLRSRPWEYWVLRAVPELWRDEDALLVVHAMWWQLQHSGLETERARLALEAALVANGSSSPRDVLRFFSPRGTRWDAPIAADVEPVADPIVPPPSAIDLSAKSPPVGVQILTRAAPAPQPFDPFAPDDEARREVGSNNWALAGSRTANGAALVANDMHLGLGVPPTWYRLQLVVGAGPAQMRVTGVSLPGTPVIVAGSNGFVAWGFTNSYGDWLDVTRARCTAGGEWIFPDGSRERATRVRERIPVKGMRPVDFDFEVARVGVRLPRAAARGAGGSAGGDACEIVSWLATSPAATNLRLLDIERARSVDDVLALAPALGMPQQNAMIGDAAGHIAWTIFGRIPQDDGVAPWLRNTGTLPWRDATTHPRLARPSQGFAWSANARVVSGAAEVVVGGDEADLGSGYDLGARARQIRDALAALPGPARPADMLKVQLDDRAVFLAHWHAHLLELLDARALVGKGERTEYRRLLAEWNGRATIDSVSYRLVRAYRDKLAERVWRVVLGTLDVRDETGRVALDLPQPAQFEGALWQLVTQRPPHLLPVTSEGWRAFELETVDATLDELAKTCRTLASCRWGTHGIVVVRHPLSGAMPTWIAPYLDMQPMQIAGDHDMPRVQGRSFGASERFAVSPGHEDEAYLEIAGGQSGHPLSPWYRAGFDAWANGEALPFLPGKPVHRLQATPAAR